MARAQVNPRIGVAYLRVSTSEQRLGPEAQREAIEQWAEREGVRIVSWHEDTGVSGSAPLDERPALTAAVETLGQRRAGVLVVAKRDRLARDVYIAAGVQRSVERLGARVACADGSCSGDTAADNFMRSVVDAAAEYERALLRGRTKAALAAKKRRGEMTGKPPYGMRVGADGVHLEPDAAEQSIIARARELRDAGANLATIVRQLDAGGVRNRAGKPFMRTSVVHMLG